MDAEEKEAALKKRLQQFLIEMFKMGTVRGFQHFSMYLRGKEELGVTVYHEPQMSRRCSVIQPEVAPGESLTSARLPYDPRALVLSHGTQQALSGMGDQGVGLPPASPSDNEMGSDSAVHSTLFLVAGYARYSCPYVWVRSNHTRLMRMSGASDTEKDNPLRLKSTARWKDGDVFIWDIIAELVKLCMYPAPRNPFAVDLNYFLSLPLQQQVLSSAAMITCLQKIMLHASDDRPYAGKVLDELQLVSRLHYTALQSLAKQRQLPILEQHLQQQQNKRQAQAKQRTFSQSRTRYPSTENQSSPYSSQPYAGMSVQSTQGVYTPQGSAEQGFPGYGFTPAPSLF
ncbi:hypothetical protein BaRGS_00009480 [Batillaria attramentaria]|uniref:DUF7886 domain-containing protein n=1 Tax=Batillaria attramentaria TaxID=370345 RepID=A0ABD0LIC0_9CAEN